MATMGQLSTSFVMQKISRASYHNISIGILNYESVRIKSNELVMFVPQPRTFSSQESLINYVLPICSIYGIFTHIWHTFMVNVGKYSRHGASS